MGDAATLRDGDRTFRDLNKNGMLDPYEDPRRPVEERVEDLLAQMTLPEKARRSARTAASTRRCASARLRSAS